jgi:hypothetical protein
MESKFLNDNAKIMSTKTNHKEFTKLIIGLFLMAIVLKQNAQEFKLGKSPVVELEEKELQDPSAVAAILLKKCSSI